MTDIASSAPVPTVFASATNLPAASGRARTPRVCLLTHKYLDKGGESFNIGGVETIARTLVEYLQKGFELTVLQLSEKDFERTVDRTNVVGKTGTTELRKRYDDECVAGIDLTICLTYEWAFWLKAKRAVIFQHGIEFDGFYSDRSSFWRKLQISKQRLRNHLYKLRTRQLLESGATLICVDLNFINWVRAAFPFSRWEQQLVYIPNFGPRESAEGAASKAKRQSTNDVTIIVPRRFEVHRGTVLFASVARRILDRRGNVRFIFVGGGTREGTLRQILGNNPRCVIQSAAYEEMPALYQQADMAVIPTLWSEGTSLSCIEAMCYGCAIVATNVGGLGNLVLDEHNGLLVSPNEEALEAAVLRLIDSPEIRRKVILNAAAIYEDCFNKDQWLSRVDRVLQAALRTGHVDVAEIPPLVGSK